MKRVLCLVLCFAFILSFAACGGKKTDSRGEIDKLAAKGEIPEYEVKLGSTAEFALKHYEDLSKEQNNEDLILSEYEGSTAVNLMNGVQSFYYEKQHADKGISVVAVTGGYAYGLELGNTTTKNDVLKKLAADYTEQPATADDLFFLPGTMEGAKVITANFDNIKLEFFFFDDFLSAVCLTDTNYWNN